MADEVPGRDGRRMRHRRGRARARGCAAGRRPGTPTVDWKGNIRVPADYRKTYRSLGSWALASDAGQGSKGMHVVYGSRGAAEAYRAGGAFADRTVRVKEIYATRTDGMTTGTVSRAEELKGWFVMVREVHARGQPAQGRRLGMVMVRRREAARDDDQLP